MYAVVGCSDCQALWVIEGRSDTLQCPRCNSQRKYEKRRTFVTTDDEDHAREVRSSILANRQGHGDAFAELDSFADLDDRVDTAGPSDETYLDESGVDADAVAAAGERAESGRAGGSGDGGSRSRQRVVRDALWELDDPTEDAVVAYADDHGVPAGYTRRALEKLVRAGEATENRGVYRLV